MITAAPLDTVARRGTSFLSHKTCGPYISEGTFYNAIHAANAGPKVFQGGLIYFVIDNSANQNHGKSAAQFPGVVM